MTKKKNIGLTMVEILISLAIFLILMIPIVKTIVTSLNSATASKEVQYRNDYAENLMEHVKTVPAGEIEDASYYTNSGSTDVKVGSTAPGTGNYKVEGKVELGTEKTKYSYRIEVDSTYYDNLSTAFFNPNDIELGLIENMDYRHVAYIDGTVLNNDSSVEQYYKLEKLAAMKDVDPVGYKQEMEGDANILAADAGYRLSTIEVSGDKTAGYRVRCIMTYKDSNVMYLTQNYKEITAFDQTFKDELPNIYFTYNPCFYNGGYSSDDYIAIDTRNLTDSSAEVNIFLVEISEKLSQNLVDSGAADNITDSKGNAVKDNNIYNADTKTGIWRDDVQIHLVGVKDKGSSSVDFLNRIHVYHNIGDNSNADSSAKRNLKSDISMLKYTASDGALDNRLTDSADSFMKYKNDIVDANGFKKYNVEYINLIEGNVESMDKAASNSREMYQVKIWLQEGDSVDTTNDPILQGSKGGSKS